MGAFESFAQTVAPPKAKCASYFCYAPSAVVYCALAEFALTAGVSA